MSLIYINLLFKFVPGFGQYVIFKVILNNKVYKYILLLGNKNVSYYYSLKYTTIGYWIIDF